MYARFRSSGELHQAFVKFWMDATQLYMASKAVFVYLWGHGKYPVPLIECV